jgi:glutamine cyclotransferase
MVGRRQLVEHGRMWLGTASDPRCRGGTLLVGAALVMVTLAGCSGSQGEAAASTAPATPSASPTPSLVPATDITTAGGTALPVKDADWVQVAGGHVWTTLGSEVAQQLDAATGAEQVAVPTKGQVCTAMDQGFGSLWIAVCSSPGRVLRLDPASGKVLARISLPPDLAVLEEGSVGSGEGFVWVVATGQQRTLVKIDPTTNRVVDRVPVEVGVVAARVGEGALWTTNVVTGAVERRDPSTGRLVTSVPTGKGARFFAVGEGAVWVQNNIDGTVTRVDPATNRAVATIRVDRGPVDGGDLAVGGGSVWARVTDTLVARIDPATNTVVARYSPPQGSGSVAADAGALWVSAHDKDVVYRLPLK